MMAQRHIVQDCLISTIPMEWLTRLRTLRRAANVWTTAMIILHWYTHTGRSSFFLSSAEFFPPLEMSRYAIRRALKRLEGLGLIRVQRARGLMARVTVVVPTTIDTHQAPVRHDGTATEKDSVTKSETTL
jgi:hypothetical protein